MRVPKTPTPKSDLGCPVGFVFTDEELTETIAYLSEFLEIHSSMRGRVLEELSLLTQMAGKRAIEKFQMQ